MEANRLLELRRVGADGSGTFVGFLGGDEGARDDRLRLIALDFTGETSGRPAAWRMDIAAEGAIPKTRKNTYKDHTYRFVDLVRQARIVSMRWRTLGTVGDGLLFSHRGFRNEGAGD